MGRDHSYRDGTLKHEGETMGQREKNGLYILTLVLLASPFYLNDFANLYQRLALVVICRLCRGEVFSLLGHAGVDLEQENAGFGVWIDNTIDAVRPGSVSGLWPSWVR